MEGYSCKNAATILIPILLIPVQIVVISLLVLVAGDACRDPRDTRGVSTREEARKGGRCVAVSRVHVCSVGCVRCRIGCGEDRLWKGLEREKEWERVDKRRGGIWKVIEGGLRRVDGEDDDGLPEQETKEYQHFPAHEDCLSKPPLPFIDGLYVPDCGGVKT